MEEKELDLQVKDGNKFYLVAKVSRWTKIRNYILQKMKWKPKDKTELFWNKMKANFSLGVAEPVEIRIDAEELKKW